jgi:hypothetical protein
VTEKKDRMIEVPEQAIKAASVGLLIAATELKDIKPDLSQDLVELSAKIIALGGMELVMDAFTTIIPMLERER